MSRFIAHTLLRLGIGLAAVSAASCHESRTHLLDAPSYSAWYRPLYAALGDATRLVVHESGAEPGAPPLLVVDDPDALAELIERVEVDPHSTLRCRCPGDYQFEFTARGGSVVMSLHHMRALSLRGWPADGILTPRSLAAITDWFAAQGEERFELLRLRGASAASEPTRAWYRILRHWPEAGRDLIAEVDGHALSTADGARAFGEALADEMGGPVEAAVAAFSALGHSDSHLWSNHPLEAPAWAVFASLDGPEVDASFGAVPDDPTALLGAARAAFGTGLLDRLPPDRRDHWMVRLADAVEHWGTYRDGRALIEVLRHDGGPQSRAWAELRAP